MLTDISLNNDFDGKDFNAEKKFWSDPSTKEFGTFVNWPLGLAGILSPKHFPASKVQSMANGSVWKLDQIPDRIQQIRNWLLTPLPNKKTLVQYVHCTAGCDRTGEVIGAYRMRYNNANTIDMYSKDTFIVHDQQIFPNKSNERFSTTIQTRKQTDRRRCN